MVGEIPERLVALPVEWAAESNGRYRADIAEATRAQMTKDKIFAAWQRGELFDLRKGTPDWT